MSIPGTVHAPERATEILEPRAQWIAARRAESAHNGDTNMSQMHFARLGRITKDPDGDRRRPHDYPCQHQPPGSRADGHRH